MFHKVQLKLTALFTTVSGLILVGMSLLFLFVQTQNLYANTKSKFQQNLNSFLYSFESDPVVTYNWIRSVENNYGYEMFIFDNGIPMRFLQDTKSECKTELIEKLRADHTFINDHTKNTAEIIKYQTKSEKYFAGIISLHGNAGITEIYVLLPLRETKAEQIGLYIQFGIINGAGIILLLAFSRLFTKKLLRPIQESQQRQTKFIAAASHEIRNPVNTMLSALDAIEQVEQPRSREYLNIAKKEGQRLAFLTNDLLTLVRSDNKSMVMNFGTAELDTIVLECYEAFSQPAREKQITLLVSLEENALIASHADGQRIRQVVSILLDNAISYTGEHGKIILGCKCVNNEFVISVSDNGAGLTEEQKQHVFERFYRGDESRHSKSHFGLGLSIAKEIADLHNGKITVEDADGGGTIFKLWLKK